jgi:molybdate transport system substrate-binding protein
MVPAIAMLIAFAAAPARADGTLVFAAASLRNALDEVVAGYQRQTGRTVKVSYAASSALAKQIAQGAEADVLVSADLDWMDYVEKLGLVKPGTRANLLGNSLVLVAPKASTATIRVAPGFDLARVLGDGRLAMADPESVPAGKYGKAALTSLGAWDAVAPKIAPSENVRAALKLVSLGEAPFGIVYGSDAFADDTVKVVGTFPAESHPPIVYPVALITGGRSTEAADFVAVLKSPAATTIFEKHGFTKAP